MVYVKIYGVICILGGVLLWCHSEGLELERQRAIVREVSYLAEQCMAVKDGPVFIRDKCLIWDLTRDTRGKAYDKLPSVLRGRSNDRFLTIFLITEKRMEMKGYCMANQPGCTKYADVCIVNWPEKQAVGIHTIECSTSVLFAPVQEQSKNGEMAGRVAQWILDLQKSKLCLKTD